MVYINSDLAGYKFGTTSDGEPGYIMPGGADTVIPFSRKGYTTASMAPEWPEDGKNMTFDISGLAYYRKLTMSNLYASIAEAHNYGTTNKNVSIATVVTGYNSSTGIVTVRVTGDMKYITVRLFVLP